MTVSNQPPRKTLQDLWDELVADFQMKKQKYGAPGRSPISMWDTNPPPRGHGVNINDARMFVGNKPVDYLQNKVIPFWQRLTTPRK